MFCSLNILVEVKPIGVRSPVLESCRRANEREEASSLRARTRVDVKLTTAAALRAVVFGQVEGVVAGSVRGTGSRIAVGAGRKKRNTGQCKTGSYGVTPIQTGAEGCG